MIRLDRTAGFTLLELLCALAVLAILVTLAAPLAGRFRTRTQGLQCAANLKGLGVGAAAYLTDHNDIWPQIASDTSLSPAATPPPAACSGAAAAGSARA
jgi:prepilin-type N-terminal cleavage/methylation domain-containing protein